MVSLPLLLLASCHSAALMSLLRRPHRVSALTMAAGLGDGSPLTRRARFRKRGLAKAAGKQHVGDAVPGVAVAAVQQAAAAPAAPLPFRYLCVVDVEATCQKNNRDFVHEIIELPVVVVDLQERRVVAEFQSYVCPTRNPTLSHFCTKLTGITQELVDAAPTLDTVMERLDAWLLEQGLANTPEQRSFAFAADGPWDLQFFLEQECTRKGIPRPKYFDKWVNLKRLFADFYGCRQCRIVKMLERQGMRFVGRPHSGIDDSRNIARIAIRMANDGCTMYINEALPAKPKLVTL